MSPAILLAVGAGLVFLTVLFFWFVGNQVQDSGGGGGGLGGFLLSCKDKAKKMFRDC